MKSTGKCMVKPQYDWSHQHMSPYLSILLGSGEFIRLNPGIDELNALYEAIGCLIEGRSTRIVAVTDVDYTFAVSPAEAPIYGKMVSKPRYRVPMGRRPVRQRSRKAKAA